MQDEAEKRGWQLVYTDAAGSAATQVADVRSMIAQGVDVILLSPREEKPLIPAVMEARKAGICQKPTEFSSQAMVKMPWFNFVQAGASGLHLCTVRTHRAQTFIDGGH